MMGEGPRANRIATVALLVLVSSTFPSTDALAPHGNTVLLVRGGFLFSYHPFLLRFAQPAALRRFW